MNDEFVKHDNISVLTKNDNYPCYKIKIWMKILRNGSKIILHFKIATH